MTLRDLNPKQHQQIIDMAKNALLKLGINAEVKIKVDENMFDTPYLFISTDEFNTTPVIYKSIRVSGNGYLERGEGDFYKLQIPLGYNFTLFDGGTNGVRIGSLNLTLAEDSDVVWYNGFVI